MLRKSLLVCGVLSSLLYVAMNIVIPLQWEGYSLARDAISELSAIDAPTRQLWAWPGALYTALVIAFGCGVWMTAGRTGSLHLLGGLILVFGGLGLLWPFAPMHSREVIAAGGGTLTDTMHLVLAGVSVVLMVVAIVVGARAFGGGFQVYSFATLAVLVAFGVLTFMDASKLEQNLPTPWMGVWERINIGAFMLWIVVLAARLLHAGSADRPGLRMNDGSADRPALRGDQRSNDSRRADSLRRIA